MIKRLVAIPLSFLVSLIVSGIATYLVVVRPMRRSWGIDPDEAARTLPGDDFVPAAGITDTRGISIDAAAEAVWPWLPQMGYDRAGWYSYDRLDNRGGSATRLMPEFGTLAVGDIVPTWPGGGFRVEAIDPGRSLVLYLDTDLANAQADEAAAAAGDADAQDRDSCQPEGGGCHGWRLDARLQGQLGLRHRARGRHAQPAHRALPRLVARAYAPPACVPADAGPGRLRDDAKADAGPQGACRTDRHHPGRTGRSRRARPRAAGTEGARGRGPMSNR